MYDLESVVKEIAQHVNNNSVDAAVVVLAGEMLNAVHSSEVRNTASDILDENI